MHDNVVVSHLVLEGEGEGGFAQSVKSEHGA